MSPNAPSIIYRTRAEQLTELAADLSATWQSASLPATVSSWISRPAILRRLADALAYHVRPDIDRIVSVGAGGSFLASAVGLATGLPFYADSLDGPVGELHAGEHACAVSVFSPEAMPDVLGLHGIQVTQHVCVVVPAGLVDRNHVALFTLDNSGVLHSTKGTAQ